MKAFFSEVQRGMEWFGGTIGTLVNTVLLFAVYVVGVGLTSLAAKIVGKHFLDMGIQKDAKSYWSELHLKKKPTDSYYRQF